MKVMKALEKRLRRLEQQFVATPEESAVTCRLTERLEAARRRCGLAAPSAERLAQISGMGITGILNAGRSERARRV